MMSRTRKVLSVVALCVAAFGSSGCDTNPVQSSTAAIEVRYVPSPSGAGRYEEASFLVFKIDFAPLDPELAPLLGGESYTMRFGTFTTNLLELAPVDFASIALPPGSYQVTQIEFRPPTLIDRDASTTSPNCIERISTVPSGPAGAEVPTTYVLDASDGYAFTVSPGQTKLDIVVDVPGLIAAYEGAFTCALSCGGGGPCLQSFDADAFRAGFVDHVTFQ